jgi:hypothetical protein
LDEADPCRQRIHGLRFTRRRELDQIGTPVTIAMATNAYIGIAMCEPSGYLDTATFDNVSINSTANPAPVITGLSATTASIGSQVVIGGNNFGAAQAGSVVLLKGVPMTINLWSNEYSRRRRRSPSVIPLSASSC